MENYIELQAIHTKMKRSLIPIIRKGLGYLFIPVTESDLNTIHPSVSRLAESKGDSLCCRLKYLSYQYN